MSAEILHARTHAEISLASAFERSRARLPGSAGVAQWREDSFKAFEAAGLPHRRVESWHYTDLRTLMREALPLTAPPDRAALDFWRERLSGADAAGPRLVVADGFFVPELSSPLPSGVAARSLASVLLEGRPDLIALLASQELGAGDPIIALNAALMQDGVVIEVMPGAIVPEPLHLLHVTASPLPAAHFSRSAVIIGAGASVKLVESCLAQKPQASQANACLIVALGEGAELLHTERVTTGGASNLRLETLIARLGARVKFNSFALVSGIGLIRRQIFARFEGQGAQASLSGVALLSGREHADTTLFVDHAAPACISRETFRTILDGEATGIFQGRIHVAQGAQKTDGKMLSRAVLLSDQAVMNNKPELEIFADDVICGHGATCGGLNPDQLFYLQTRGLPLFEAEALLLEAFAGELIDGIGDDELASPFRRDVRSWLAARRPAPAANRERTLA